MKKIFNILLLLLALVIVLASCDDDKKRAEMRRRATELAMQRTDSVAKFQEDSLTNIKVKERRRADSLAKVDSLRRIYERNHITLEGTVGGESARLRLNRNGDAVSGTYSGSGVQISVHGTWLDGVTASGTQMVDSVVQTKVNIRLQHTPNDEFTGTVTVTKDGSSSTQRAVMQRF